MSSDTPSSEEAFEEAQDFSEDWPYCECGNETMEEEEAFNVCSSCGKPLT